MPPNRDPHEAQNLAPSAACDEEGEALGADADGGTTFAWIGLEYVNCAALCLPFSHLINHTSRPTTAAI
jgi:hypothetical protein